MSGDACDVCQGGPVIGVGSSLLGAISFAYCDTCAEYCAEPYKLVVVTFALDNMSTPEAIFDAYGELYFRFVWASVLRAGKTAAEFWADIATEIYSQATDPLLHEVTT